MKDDRLEGGDGDDTLVSIPLRGKGCESLFVAAVQPVSFLTSFNPLAGKGL